MPAGLTWGAYTRVFSAYLLSMLAGAQTVHHIYKPLEDFHTDVEKRKKEIRAEREQATIEGKSST